MQNQNYDKFQNQILSEIKSKGEKPTLLLHSCCAPCSTYCLEKITPYFDVTIFYYNPNITDKEEYLKRLSEQKSFVNKVYGDKIKIIDLNYDKTEFLSKISGHEKDQEGGKRCELCFRLRLQKTCEYALLNAFDCFTTTLSVSPYKNAKMLNEIGEALSKEYGVKYLYADFKKEGGYLKSIELSKKYDLYRQNYCGCEFSKRD